MAKKNLNALSKAELVALLEAAQTAQEAVPAPVAAPAASPDKEELLTNLLIRRLEADTPKEIDAQDTKISVELENISGMALFVQVRDPFNGSTKVLAFDAPGAKNKVSPRQLRELRVEYPTHFENGLLNVVGEVPDNPNVIPDIPAFLASLDANEVNETIQKITSAETLFRLYYFLESKRYTNKDKEGNILTRRGPDGQPVPILETVQLPEAEMVVLSAVQRRIQIVAGVNVRIDA